LDYYVILGISRSATDEQIKKAYRKKALEYHPDKNKNPDAVKLFKQITEAFETLSDPLKKLQFDATGFAGPRSRSRPSPPKYDPNPFKYANFKDDPKEKRTKPTQPKPEDYEWTDDEEMLSGRSVRMKLRISPKLAKEGGKKEVTIEKRRPCERCLGTGSRLPFNYDRTEECKHCIGKGFGFLNAIPTKCDDCGGLGFIPKDKCYDCKGTGFSEYYDEKHIVVIPRNCPHGHVVKVSGGGELSRFGGSPKGRLIVTVLIEGYDG